MVVTESYREFLDRVHREDIAHGKGIHKPGHCTICDDHRRSTVVEQPQKG